ncbi:MAG: thiamine-phosphate kinase [Cyanobacteria bacterium P01_D01_bin.56]
MTTIADLGEQEVLKRLHRFCAQEVGDDAAVQSLPAQQQLVVTTDVLVDGVHFSDRTLSPLDLGWRAAAVNLSDLAAMGSVPLGITVGLTLPPHTPWPWLEAVYQGLSDCLGTYGGAVLGGDLCRGLHRSLAITALGTVHQHRALYRDRAQVGQALVSTGIHGASRAGLALLLGELETSSSVQAWTVAHQRPIPRFDAIAVLNGLNPNINTVAAMDTSDGLADAVIQMCTQSQVGAALMRSQLPMPSGLVDAVGLATATQWTLYGGEDFELLLSLPQPMATEFIQQLPGSQIVGYITAKPDICLVDDMTHGPDIYLDQSQGFQHFDA